ncbi:unnamed protein product [Notodromas monacha]|uniref:Y+L amino acid transporter 2 n=1 Tax=Notodromas monacha TaxID=399045 RepID=A0A7R9BR30_9CRUS|nr:unnamed protein product [Notodromas monacha]CAG0919211.1 unnamed protein product [Notodromas monacha]
MGEGKNSYSPADKEEREKMMPDGEGPSALQIDEGTPALKPKLGLMNGVTVIVGSIIGSGIFISPTGVLKGTGSSGMALIMWTVCGIFSTIGAYCYCELGCMITKSGADYAYIMEAFGPFCGFLRLWVECMIVRPASQAIVSLTFAIYALRPFYADCESPDDAQRLLAASCIFILTAVNCWDVKWATRVQDVFTFAKVIALIIIIIAGMYELCQGHFEHFNFENTETDIKKISLAAYAGLFAYNGWNYLNYIVEELIDPLKNLPRAVAISCTLVTVIYVLTNVAFFTAMSPLEMLESQAVAVTFADKLFGMVSFTIPIFVAMSTFGAVNGILLTSSRLFYVGAREGQMPEILTHIQLTRATPAPAVLFQIVLRRCKRRTDA